jgi:hypothetical protein
VAGWLKCYFWAAAKRADRDPNRCWARIAMWYMGWEGYGLSGKISKGCDYCGKCLSKPVESDGDRGKP